MTGYFSYKDIIWLHETLKIVHKLYRPHLGRYSAFIGECFFLFRISTACTEDSSSNILLSFSIGV